MSYSISDELFIKTKMGQKVNGENEKQMISVIESLKLSLKLSVSIGKYIILQNIIMRYSIFGLSLLSKVIILLHFSHSSRSPLRMFLFYNAVSLCEKNDSCQLTL